MKEFFKWLLVIILGILACPFLLAAGGFIAVLLVIIAVIIATSITITAPLWVPVMAVGLMVDLIDNCCE